ncbi:tetratricopeptide repeat protein [Flavobacterium stagni]|uniref:Tetratricopeptide repeat protein n=2 Tax=Flavobacterium stagni TaxID=2506421 RepID=A0A4Q1K9L7_9FLAO|nr:tetratricopeptide repeat protein [Flavobacterium stagni]
MAFYFKLKFMKIKNVILGGTLLIGLVSFAQKDELKALKKLYGKDKLKPEEVAEYKSLLTKLESLATEESDKVYTSFYKSFLPFKEILSLDPSQLQNELKRVATPVAIKELANTTKSTLDFEKKSGKKIYTDDIAEKINLIKPQLLNIAIDFGNVKKYKESAEILYSIYLLDTKVADNLYYAANYAIQAKDYESALKYFKELKDIKYTGEATQYLAKNKVTNEFETFGDKEVRDKLVALGNYTNPKEEKIPSRKGEIYRNYALILIETGKSNEAKAALAEARVENPNDTDLIIAEADVYLKMNDIAKYQSLIKEALDKNPNDHILLYNLGVTSGNNNQLAEAEKYYNQVIKIDPNYINAYLNLSDIVLRPDAKMVEEMNKLGTTAKDQKRYEALKAERQALFNKAMPILEKAYQLDPSNDIVKTNLLSVYRFLELSDKVKQLKESK